MLSSRHYEFSKSNSQRYYLTAFSIHTTSSEPTRLFLNYAAFPDLEFRFPGPAGSTHLFSGRLNTDGFIMVLNGRMFQLSFIYSKPIYYC
jgi:hypothetical protein